MTTADMTIAIADDDPIVCQSLATIMTATHAADVLWTAGDGATATTRYFDSPTSRPDVLLIDIQMPGSDGLAAARAILARDPAARILFLTTFADRAYIEQAIALGARGYLIKQDVASVAPALHAVMAGQIVLGADVLGKITGPTAPIGAPGLPHDPVTSTADAATDADRMALDALDERSRMIAALVAEGLDNRDIAARLYLSEGTVRNRISAMLDRLGLTNRTQLAILWINTYR